MLVGVCDIHPHEYSTSNNGRIPCLDVPLEESVLLVDIFGSTSRKGDLIRIGGEGEVAVERETRDGEGEHKETS